MRPARRLSFEQLNRIRIERLSALFPVQKQSFLEVLPLLFQTNSELLPGYHGPDTPAGIVDYQPSDHAIAAARRINAAFQYQRHALHHYAIRGVYLINRQDFFRYHPKAHFDLWLVYAEPMEPHQRQLLEKKLASVCQWAHTTFEIHCHPRLLAQQELPGSTLSDPERDQFYHSGLVLAGSHPAWWTLSPHDDPAPARPLQTQFRHTTLDFGALAPASALAIANLTLESIHQAISQGLEACLNLIYYDTALRHFASFEWISEQIKQRLLAGTSKPRLLDADNIKLQLIQQQCQDKQAVLLAQQSLYVLCNERLSKPVNNAALPWRREFITDCVEQWDWPDRVSRLKQLDQRYQSRYRDAVMEYQAVSQAVEHTVVTLKQFVQQHKLDLDTPLYELEHRCRYLFHPVQDQIPCLPPPFLPRQYEQYLYLSREHGDADWLLHDQDQTVASPALYQHRSLLAVLAWAIQNQLLHHGTHLKLADKTEQIRMNSLLDLVSFMLRTELTTKQPHHKRFSFSALTQCDTLLLFANLNHHPVSTLSQKGLEISSLQSDPLNHASQHQNLLASLEGLTCSAAGQWFYSFHRGQTALPDSLLTLFGWDTSSLDASHIACWCSPGNHAARLKKRIHKLISGVVTHYHKSSENGGFILKLGGHFYKLHWQQGQHDLLTFPRQTTLLDCLQSQQKTLSVTGIDHELDQDSRLSTLLNHARADSCALFVLQEDDAVLLYILDELGNLFEQTYHSVVPARLIAHYAAFLRSLATLPPSTSIRCFQIQHTSDHSWSSSPLPAEKTARKADYLPVTVELDSLKDDSPCTIHCGKSAFSGSRNDAALFNQVKQFVLQLRRHTDSYPLYITKLRIHTSSRLTTKDYIIHKHLIETALNR